MEGYDEYILTSGEDFEYWCPACRQLRLCCEHPFKKCGNCGHEEVVKGKPGSLNREKLEKEHQR